MDLEFSAEHLAFRDEVRAFIDAKLPDDLRTKIETGAHLEHADQMRWQKILYEKGWAAPHWPEKYGGTGWDITRRHIFLEEMALAGAPTLSPFGLTMLAPLLMEYGTDEQRERFLPKILSGEEAWCQGYSEPGAGSDLASLKMRADSDGDHYVLNGQKTWTTDGQYADWIFCLVRTDDSGKKQDGISFVLVDIHNTPGVEVKPFLNISGTTAFADTFFTDARVPKSNRVGPEGGGWSVAKALLKHERTMVAGVPQNRRALEEVKCIARNTEIGDRKLIDDPVFRARIAELEVRHKALEVSNLRALSAMSSGRREDMIAPSVLKVRGSELTQHIHELAMDALGYGALGWFDSGDVLPADQRWVASRFNYSRATTIYAGSNEIQRNILAKAVLGLPSGR
jgi:alkylation response protein AidB-like acyl-CoA dehydrogenase